MKIIILYLWALCFFFVNYQILTCDLTGFIDNNSTIVIQKVTVGVQQMWASVLKFIYRAYSRGIVNYAIATEYEINSKQCNEFRMCDLITSNCNICFGRHQQFTLSNKLTSQQFQTPYVDEHAGCDFKLTISLILRIIQHI